MVVNCDSHFVASHRYKVENEYTRETLKQQEKNLRDGAAGCRQRYLAVVWKTTMYKKMFRPERKRNHQMETHRTTPPKVSYIAISLVFDKISSLPQFVGVCNFTWT